jgi:anti-anti-sigma regulatory factor
MNPFRPTYPLLTRTPRVEPARAPTTEPLLLEGGYYDASRRQDLKRELRGVDPHSDVVLDLAHTACFDCSCLGILIAKLLVWRQRDPDTNLRLRNIAPSLASTLHLLKLDEVFIVESVR